LATPGKKARAMSHSSIFTILTLLLLIAALPINSALVGRRIQTLTFNPRQKLIRYARTILVLWSLTALAAYALRLHGRSVEYVGVRMPHSESELAAGLVVLAAPLAALLAGAPRTAPAAKGLQAIVPADAAQWSAFVAVAASAGICEEFLYRGYALTLIAKLTASVPLGVAASTLAFGFAHAYQGRRGIAGATLSGLLFAAVFLVTGSLYPCMIGHFVQDIAGGAILSRRSTAVRQESASA
jgi:membrane protease YdiL (CAAX protease family)